ncbi:hypothetical protein DICSQDRAFT_144357 [Dichomitus squalens LYAD-421 SS1]|uniref:uncharacterized protein n=1 Tax=Dichomitus squalens (strain LYAD-421) TaxID=732165 RepID=UPI0004415D3A|nr:uncharacterized protein DICSQDRAFT_144357 [Dichomitus squalens LYAD-421 SS1]EJF64593.1 hypothetical protein DICSQDRAFT_144357 [Dichomitus squalens LYAD-421 SS1]
MSATDGYVKPNAHPEAPKTNPREREHSDIYHPPADNGPSKAGASKTQFPETGWNGPIPSQSGGDKEQDFMNKPPYFWKSEGDRFKRKHFSRCWCGNVEFEFHGDPLNAKHCHCKQCQHLHGAPFQWAVIFPKTSVRMISNKNDSLHFFSTQRRQGIHDVPCKVSCNECRSPMFDEGRNTVLAYPSSFKFPNGKVPTDFQPTAHIFYSQRTVALNMCGIISTMPKYKGKHEEGPIDMRNDDKT